MPGPEFLSLDPVPQALLAGILTWTVTALGAAMVFAGRTVSRLLQDVMLGFAAGVMLAASYWSLLAPAVELSQGSRWVWFPPVAGFLAGGLFLRVLDAFLPHLHPGLPLEKAEGRPTSWQRSTLLVSAITLHNIPEGLAVGVAFGAAALHLQSSTPAAAIALTVGIALQNFPEGLAASLPLRAEGMSRSRSFWYGQLSAVVEPIAAVVGAAAVMVVQPFFPTLWPSPPER